MPREKIQSFNSFPDSSQPPFSFFSHVSFNSFPDSRVGLRQEFIGYRLIFQFLSGFQSEVESRRVGGGSAVFQFLSGFQ